MKIRRFLSLENPHWGALPHLPQRLAEVGVKVGEIKIELPRYPETIEYDNLPAALEDLKARGTPRRFFVTVNGGQDGQFFLLQLNRDTYEDGDRFQIVSAEGVNVVPVLDASMDLLGLKLAPPRPSRTTLERTVFIAHRFDDPSSHLADKLARFLSLLGFDVSSGRAFAPTSVAEKVKSRLEAQTLVVVILTPGEDKTWLVQESAIAAVQNKPLIVLRAQDFDFKPGLLGDLEYIPFASGAFEASFVPLLEGLREVGFAFD